MWPRSAACGFICCAVYLEIYGVAFSENRGKSILASVAGAVIPASTATTTAMGVGSLMKGLPGIGTAIGVLTMPVVSAGATWVIGKVFIQHFASGGTLLDFNPPDYREFIKAQREKLGVRSKAVEVHRPIHQRVKQQHDQPQRVMPADRHDDYRTYNADPADRHDDYLIVAQPRPA